VGVEPNPGPLTGRHLTEEQRWRIIILDDELALSPVEIARKVNTTRKAVRLVLNKYKETGCVTDRPGRGRKRKVSDADAKSMVKHALRGKPATEITRDYLTRKKRRVHVQTVRNILQEKGLVNLKIQTIDSLSEANKVKRLVYAERMIDYKWANVVFTDEKTFVLSFTPHRAWVRPGMRKTREVPRWPKKLHVWGGIGHYAKTQLYFFTENLKSPLYQQILRSRLKESRITYAPDCPPSLRKKWLFLQDNSRIHTTDSALDLVQELVPQRLVEHPSQSPDLNAIEDVWSYLTRQLENARITTIDGLKFRLRKEWKELPWTEIRKSVASMGARLRECIKLQGARTQY